MADNGEDDEEVDDAGQGADHVVVLSVGLARVGDKVAGVLDVEDGADADGAKVAHKQGVLPVVNDVGGELVAEADGGDAAEGKDHEAEGEEAADGDAGARGVVELAPGDDGANVHEAAKVEQHVDARVDLVVAALRLLEELAVPVEGAAGDGAGENVVGADGAAGAHDEKAEGGGEEHVRLGVDPAPLEGELDGLAGGEADDGAVDHGHDDVVDPGLHNPVLEGLAGTAADATNLLRGSDHQVVTANVGAGQGLGDRIGVAHEVDGEHEEREAEPVVDAGLGGDDLTDFSGHVLVGKGTLGDGLGQDGIGRGAGGGEGEAGE